MYRRFFQSFTILARNSESYFKSFLLRNSAVLRILCWKEQELLSIVGKRSNREFLLQIIEIKIEYISLENLRRYTNSSFFDNMMILIQIFSSTSL